MNNKGLNETIENKVVDETIENNTIEETIKNKEIENKTKTTRKKKAGVVLNTVSYTEQELEDLIKNKYTSHNAYFQVLKRMVAIITEKQLAELNAVMKSLDELIIKSPTLPIAELEKYVVQLPIYMYKINTKLSNSALNMEVTNHLNNLEITEKLLNIQGGTEKERLRVAEYEAMVSTFTAIVKSRVYLNVKNHLDYATKVYDGLKKALSAEIEEMKLFGKDPLR